MCERKKLSVAFVSEHLLKGFFSCNVLKTAIMFGFYGIQNNQGQGKSCQPHPSASAGNSYLDLDQVLRYRKNFNL